MKKIKMCISLRPSMSIFCFSAGTGIGLTKTAGSGPVPIMGHGFSWSPAVSPGP
jgi:hypothetical protein